MGNVIAAIINMVSDRKPNPGAVPPAAGSVIKVNTRNIVAPTTNAKTMICNVRTLPTNVVGSISNLAAIINRLSVY